MFEEASWTLKIEARGEYPIGPSDGVPPWVGRKIDSILILGALLWLLGYLGGVLGRLGVVLGSQLGSQDGAKMINTSTQKSIKQLMHLKIDFWIDSNGFGYGK